MAFKMRGFTYPGKSPLKKDPTKKPKQGTDEELKANGFTKDEQGYWVDKLGRNPSQVAAGVPEQEQRPHKLPADRSPATQKASFGAGVDEIHDDSHDYWLSDAHGKRIKSISKDEYIKHKNIPGSDDPTKATNDPDVYGRKKGGSPTKPK